MLETSGFVFLITAGSIFAAYSLSNIVIVTWLSLADGERLVCNTYSVDLYVIRGNKPWMIPG